MQTPIAEAIIHARESGIRVRMILERNYLTLTKRPPDPWAAGGENEENRRILNALMRAKIDVM